MAGKMKLRHPGGKTGATKTNKMKRVKVTAAPKYGAGVKGPIRKVRPRGR